MEADSKVFGAIAGPKITISAAKFKTLVDLLITAGADLATVAIEQVITLDPAAVQAIPLEDPVVAKSQLLKLLRQFKTSWTKKHLQETSGKGASTSSKATRAQALQSKASPLPPTVDVDAQDFNGEVNLEPVANLAAWLAKPVTTSPQMIIFLAKIEDARLTQESVPILWKEAHQVVPIRTWKQVSCLQMCPSEPVVLVRKPLTAAITTVGTQQHYVTFCLQGHHAPLFAELITKQMTGLVGGAKTGQGTVYHAKGRRPMEQIALDDQLKTVVKEVLGTLVPGIEYFSPVHFWYKWKGSGRIETE